MFRTALVAASLLIAGPTLAEDKPIGERVSVNGMEMYYEVSGAGDPIVVLHGSYMNIKTMGEIIPRLAETHQVYAVEILLCRRSHAGRYGDVHRLGR